MKAKLKNGFRRLALCLTVTGAIGYGNYIAPQAQIDFLRWKVGDSVVRVLRPDGMGGGTGFAMQGKSGENFIVTNRHVCEAAENGWMLIKSAKDSMLKRVIYRDNKHDICLLSGDKRFSPLKLVESPRVGQINFIVGHPGLRDLTVSQGEYIGRSSVRLLDESALTREDCKGEIYELSIFEQIAYGREFVCIKSFKSLSLTTPSYPGNSGSPVVNRFGQVMGILFAGNPEQERDRHAVPAEELKRVLEKF